MKLLKPNIILVLGLLLFVSSISVAGVPGEINYQGKVEDGAGAVNGSLVMTLRLFTSQSSGTPVWEEAQNVLVDQGIFNVRLGSGVLNPLYLTLEDALHLNDDLWLEVHISGEASPMAPRQKMTSVAFAIRSDLADGVPDGAIRSNHLASDAVSTDKISDGAVTAAKISGGPGSGLDSDTIDGKDSAAFAPAAGLVELQNALSALQARVDALESRNQVLEEKLKYLTVAGTDMVITGANLRVRSGSGATAGQVNGLGNVIIGYDEARATSFCSISDAYTDQSTCERDGGVWITDNKDGSHNLIVGSGHNYASYAGIAAGHENTIWAPFSTVSGGTANTAIGYASSLSGGYRNTASGDAASISGGHTNLARGELSSVSGGTGNYGDGLYSSVCGGNLNTAEGEASAILGGYRNQATGESASVSAGQNNIASGAYSSVLGGGSAISDYGNHAYANYSAILGGIYNRTGSNNTELDPDHTQGERSTISGGVNLDEGDINGYSSPGYSGYP